MVTPETIAIRQTALFGLGMSKTVDGFSFQDVKITFTTIQDLMGEDWTEHFETIKVLVQNRKESGEVEKTDAEKLLQYILLLQSIPTPDIKDSALVAHVNVVQSQINHAKSKANQLVKNQKPKSCQQN